MYATDEWDVRNRVSGGASLLDEVRPGWELEVDPNTVEISNGVMCALGQIWGTWGHGLEALEETGIRIQDEGSSLGFQAQQVPRSPLPEVEFITARRREEWDREYEILDLCWRREILTRRTADERLAGV